MFISSRTPLSAKNPLSLKMFMLMRGSSVRSSTRTKAISSSTPITIEPIVLGSSQPHVVDCWRPSTASAMPPVTSTRPR